MTAALSTAKPIVGAAINRALKRSAGRSRHAGYPITADAERTAATSRKSRIPILLSLSLSLSLSLVGQREFARSLPIGVGDFSISKCRCGASSDRPTVAPSRETPRDRFELGSARVQY